MAKRDYYEVLSVEKTVSEGDLKVSYRKLAMQFHPDRNPGNAEAEAKFKEINEAYDCLKDAQKRAAYDRYGHAAFDGSMGGGGAGFNGDFAQTMSDIFENFFGGDFGGRGGRGGGRQRGDDLQYNLEITLEEAFTGKDVEIRIPTTITCDACSGSGAKPGTSASTCRTCGGHGRVRAVQGFFTIERTCPTCQGRGQTIADPCKKCGGAGHTSIEKTLTIAIPAGIEDGNRIRRAGEGEAGSRGGPAGDLYVFVTIRPHTFFQRNAADVFCRVPISMTTAALGGQIEVPTLEGETTKVKIPEGTQSGRQIPLKGKGMPILRSRSRGDMYIQVVVETPRNLTKRQRELLEEFETSASGENHPESSGFFAKVKDFFDNLGG